MNLLHKLLVVLLSSTLLILSACDSEKAELKNVEGPVALKEQPSKQVVVYSSRKEHLIKPFFEQFTAETGIVVKYITDSAGPLITRLKAEGERTPADIFMTVDAGNLWFAKKEGVLQPLSSNVLKDNIPNYLRDPDNYWYGLTVRARTIVHSTDRVEDGDLTTYEGLAASEWKGRLCLRTSKKVYNQSLVAMLIAKHGEQKAQAIVQGWINNLATAPFSNDTKVMKAIEAGQCDVGIVNTYYFGRLQKESKQLPLALFWPNQKGNGGVHVNVSGAGITKHATNVDNAKQLIEWLSSTAAQKKYAGENLEYPVNAKVTPVPQVADWGEFSSESINLSKAGELQPKAIQLMDKVGYK